MRKTIKDKEKEILEQIKTQIQRECQNCKEKDEEKEKMNVEIDEKNKEIQDMKIQMSARLEKYKQLKLKYKGLKQKLKNVNIEGDKYENEMTRIGPNTIISTYKLSCCRNGNFSKYTADLLDVVFGPEVLATNVLKGIAGCEKPALDATTVKELQVHVANKFEVSTSMVRNAIRQKMNTCQKSWKKCKNS